MKGVALGQIIKYARQKFHEKNHTGKQDAFRVIRNTIPVIILILILMKDVVLGQIIKYATQKFHEKNHTG